MIRHRFRPVSFLAGSLFMMLAAYWVASAVLGVSAPVASDAGVVWVVASGLVVGGLLLLITTLRRPAATVTSPRRDESTDAPPLDDPTKPDDQPEETR